MNKLLGGLYFIEAGLRTSLLLLLPFVAKDLHIDLQQVGMIGSVMNLLGIFLSIPAGIWASRIGGMKILVICVLLTSIGFIGYFFSFNFIFIFSFSTIAGIGFGLFYPIVTALIAKHSKPGSQGKDIANYTSLAEIGKGFMSTISTFIVLLIGWRYTSLSFGTLSLILFFVLYFVHFPKTSIAPPISPIKKSHNYLTFLTDPYFMLATLAGVFDTFASTSLILFLPFLLLYKGMDPAILGSLTVAFFFGTFSGKLVLGRLADRYKSTNTFIVAQLLMAIVIVFIAASNSVAVIIGLSVILGILTKGTVPITLSIFTQVTEKYNDHENVFGFGTTFIAIASTLAPLILGFIAQSYNITYAFYAASITAVLAIIPVLFLMASKESASIK